MDFQASLIQNSIGLDTWALSDPTRLFHGTADNIVPMANSEKVYINLKDNGSEDIELIKINGGTHGSAIDPMIQSLVPWLESFANNKS